MSISRCGSLTKNEKDQYKSEKLARSDSRVAMPQPKVFNGDSHPLAFPRLLTFDLFCILL